MSEVADPEVLDSALLLHAWETMVNDECVPEDFLEPLSGNINYPSGKKPQQIPDAAFFKLTGDNAGARDVTIPLFKNFVGAMQEGDLIDMRGNEESLVQKSFKMQCNTIAHAHTAENYGNTAREKAPYKFTEASAKKEGIYFKEYFGKYRRQALVEVQSSNLLEYPHYNSAALNPNWFVAGVDDDDQPSYSMVYQNFCDNLVHAMNTAGTEVDAAVSPHFINRLQEWCFDRLDPLEDGDGQYFILSLPSPQVTWLKHPVNERGFGQMLRQNFDGKTLPRYHLPGLVFAVDKMVIVEDMRYPTATISGTPSASAGTHDGTLTIQYRGPGRADDGSSDPRDKTASGRQLGMVIGKGALCEWFPEKLHQEYDFKEYDRKYGTGLFGIYGVKACIYDQTDTTHSYTTQYMGSAVVAMAKPPRSGYSS